MVTHLEVTQDEKAKGQLASNAQKAADELDYIMTFNQNITHAMVRTMQDFELINMANMTLLRCDSCLDFLNRGIKYDTVTVFRNLPLLMIFLFLESVMSKAEKEIGTKKHYSGGPSKKSNWYHPR